MATESGFGTDTTAQTEGSQPSGAPEASERVRSLSYGNAIPDTQGRQHYNDPTTEEAIKRGHYIEIYHIISKQSIFFKAFLTDFTDNFNVNYNKESVFGRSDPISTYQSTERVIQIAWDLPASNLQEAKENMVKSNRLISMMYPAYDDPEAGASASNLKSGPLFKVKMGNLVCKPGLTESQGTSAASVAGLTCTIGGFKYNPVMDEGFFDPAPGILYPQSIKIDLELSILHEEELGYSQNGLSRLNSGPNNEKPRYPYGGEGPRAESQPAGTPPTLRLQDVTESDKEPGSPFESSKRQLIREAGIASELELQKDLMLSRYRVQKLKMLSPVRRLTGLFGTQERFTGGS